MDKNEKESDFITYHPIEYTEEEMLEKSVAFLEQMDKRRSIRSFSDKPVSKQVIENIIMTASTAPSGAHKQPWTYCAVSSQKLKARIKEAAEAEEYESYKTRMSDEWLEDLRPFGTDWHKPFLETAPWLIIVFKKIYEPTEEGKKNNYYVNESVGISVGMLLSAIHNAGLISLTHTPSPMNFLQKILKRPNNERPFLLIPVGYPAEGATVPNIKRKGADEIISYYE